MKTISFFDLVKKRRSIRRFKPDPIPDEYIEKVLEAARWAMSGANHQPWEFIVVKNSETMAKIDDIIVEQTSRVRFTEQSRVLELRKPPHHHNIQYRLGIKDVPVAIVVCGDPRTYQATVLANQFFSSEYDNFYMSLGNTTMIMHLAVAALGLGSQWVSVLHPWEWDLKQLLKIPKELRVYAMVLIGYPAYEPPPAYRRELNELVHYEQYDQSRYRSDEDIRKYIIQLYGRMRLPYDRGYDLKAPKS